MRTSDACGLDQLVPATAGLSLPGGGVLRELSRCVVDGRTMIVVEQCTADGGIFRWLCSCSHGTPLLTESVVQCYRVPQRTRHSAALAFDRRSIMPQYHQAIVASLAFAQSPPRRFLFLGVGAGVLMLFLREHYPRARMVGVESSKQVLALARQFFGLHAGPSLRLHASPALHFLARAKQAAWQSDVIVLDASEPHGREGFSPPTCLRTLRALQLLHRQLSQGGLLVINCAAVRGPACPSTLLEAFREAFAGGWLCQMRMEEGNKVLVGCKSRTRPAAWDSPAFHAACAELGVCPKDHSIGEAALRRRPQR